LLEIFLRKSTETVFTPLKEVFSGIEGFSLEEKAVKRSVELFRFISGKSTELHTAV